MASSLTIVSSASTTLPLTVTAPMLEVKQNYSDDWQPAPDLEFISLTISAAGNGIGTCICRRRYGKIKDVYETTQAQKESVNYMGWWVRVVIVSDTGSIEEWIGKFSSEARTLYGSDVQVSSVDIDSGDQDFIAYDAQDILRKTAISKSYWTVQDPNFVSGTTAEKDRYIETSIGWIPAVNLRDDFGNLFGNRSSVQANGIYRYGGNLNWNNRQYLEYVFEKFLGTSVFTDFAFKLTGQVELLESIESIYEFPVTITAFDIIRMMIPISHGMDFKVVSSDTGFDVQVFSLVSKEYSFGNATLPRNENRIRIRTDDLIDMVEVKIAATNDHKYSKIRLLGERMVVCTSLSPGNSTLVKKWPDAIETSYKAAGNGTTGGWRDRYRKKDYFRFVYRLFSAPDDYGVSAPILNADGTVPDNPAMAAYQTQRRRTLTWLPLQEGFDYSTIPATDNRESAIDAGQTAPMGWILDTTGTLAADFDDNYTPLEDLDIGISVLPTDWGVYLDPNPNHRLALNHWDMTDETGDLTMNPPLYDWEDLIVTLAFELDQRLSMEYYIPDGDDGSVLEIYVPNAQLWILKANTYIGVNATDSTAMNMSGPNDRILRNDSENMHGIMAGAIARYVDNRARASIKIKRFLPWGYLLGQIVSVIEEKNDSHEIEAAITSITWTADGTTYLNTGFAV